MKYWINKNYRTLIVLAFLIPIIIVAIVSISHVTQWYGVSNPITWAVYLSVGVEIAAMSAVAALSANVGKNIYIPFIIVTLIQFMGNVFFSYNFISVDAESFRQWVELVSPILQFMGVEASNLIAHKRILALLAGGMLPVISLTFLHMLVRFTEEQRLKEIEEENTTANTKNDTTENTKNTTSEKAKNVIKVDSEEELQRVVSLLEKGGQGPDYEAMRKYEEERIKPSDEELDEIERRISKEPISKEDIISALKEQDEAVLENEEDVEHEDNLDEELVNNFIEARSGYTKPEIQDESWDNIRDEILNEPVEKDSESTTEKNSNPTGDEKKNIQK